MSDTTAPQVIDQFAAAFETARQRFADATKVSGYAAHELFTEAAAGFELAATFTRDTVQRTKAHRYARSAYRNAADAWSFGA
jgi:hypothetical protein